MSLIFSAADMLPKIRLFEYQEESMKGETIAAISTAVSSSGIGIVRISGDQAFEIADRVYRSPKGKKKLSEQQSHTVHYGYICDGDEVLDEVLVVLMRAPRSFTAEDTVEIDCHGGVYAIQRVLEAVIKNGAAPAEPGEFTKRAFLNGRMDLSQAEAVMDVIEAKNEYALKSSVGQLRGSIGQKIKDLRAKIIYHIAYIESALDDPEHISLDGYPQELEKENEAWIEMIEKLIRSANDIDSLDQDITLTDSADGEVYLGEAAAGETDGMSDASLSAGETDAGTDTASEEVTDTPGEAVLTSTGTGSSFAAQAKLTREQVRSKNKETLLEIINNENVTEEQKQNAVNDMTALTENAEKEAAAELLLESKGFTDAVVSITDGSVDVVIGQSEITDAQRAQIEDIVKRKTEISGENIVITTMQSE